MTTKDCDRLSSLISDIRSRLITARLSSNEYQGIKKDLGTALMMAVSFNQAEMVDMLSRDGLIHIAAAGCWYPVLLMAVDMGFVEIMELLLEHGADIQAESSLGNALHSAVRSGSVETLYKLIRLGSLDVNAANELSGATPLHVAAQHGSLDCIRALANAGADVNVKDTSMGRTPLHYAAQTGNLAAVSCLTEHGADCSVMDNETNTPFALAVTFHDNDELLGLLQTGTDLNAFLENGQTLLHSLCHNGKPRGVRFLMQHGADPTATSQKGLSPAMTAVISKQLLCLKELLTHPSARATVDEACGSGKTAMWYALQGFGTHRLAAVPILDTLLEAGSDINKPLPSGSTLLMEYAESADVVTWLLSHGANPDYATEDGRSVLSELLESDLAELGDANDILLLMLQYNMDLHLCDIPKKNTGLTPLQRALESGHAEIVSTLIFAGCDLKNFHQWSHFHDTYDRTKGCASLTNVLGYIQLAHRQPRTLQDVSRAAVLKTLGHSNHTSEKIGRLGLSDCLRLFLTRESYSCWKRFQYNQTVAKIYPSVE